MFRALTALGGSLLIGVTAPAAAAAAAAPVPGAFAQASGLVAGPHVTASGATVWVESSPGRWQLRSVAAGTRTVETIASGELSSYDDYDSGEFSETSLGQVEFAGDRVLIEERSESGTRKYFQYVHGSTVSAYALTVPSAGTREQLAACSTHEDNFNGAQPGAPPRPYPWLATGGGTLAVNLCGKTKYFAADLATPAATVDEPIGPAAVAGDLVVRASTTPGNRYAVTNWRDGSPRYEIPAAGAVGSIGGVALDTDGTVAAITHPTLDANRCDGTLTWHTPAAPAGSIRATGVCGGPLTFTGGQLTVAVEPVPGGDRQLTVVGADGAPTPVAWLWRADKPYPAFAISAAGQATFAVPGCDERWTIARSTGNLAPYAHRCPTLSLRKASRRGRTLTVRVRLAADATGPVTLSYRARGQRFRATLTPADGIATAALRLPRWALGRKGTTTVTYAGDAQFVRQVAMR